VRAPHSLSKLEESPPKEIFAKRSGELCSRQMYLNDMTRDGHRHPPGTSRFFSPLTYFSPLFLGKPIFSLFRSADAHNRRLLFAKRFTGNKWISVLLGVAFAATANATTYHVSISGNDTNSGNELAPFRTIQKGADVAVTGDTVVVHAGTYREHVKPKRGGSSERDRITYKAADGEEVWIKGSERIQTWVDEGGGVWRVGLPDTYFNGYNPYTTNLSGKFIDYGANTTLLGNVYLNGEVCRQRQSLAEVQSGHLTWHTSTTGGVTTIRANFGTSNPNSELAEINVRKTVFYADSPGLSYITVEGLNFAHAANNWAPPLGSAQIGMVMPRDSRSWIIENCTLEYARCVAISIGMHDPADWPGDLVNNGHHIIRNNIIRKCGQGGIAGCSFNSVCLIEENLIEDINYFDEFGGPETAGIKLHWSVDTVMRGNCIRRVSSGQWHGYGIWIDFSNQGTRISGNTILQTKAAPVFLEANFGPILLDNNIFIGERLRTSGSEASVFVNNLFVDSGITIAGMDDRKASYYVPHTLTVITPGVVSGTSYEKAYNNIFIGGSNAFSGTNNTAGANLYLNGAQKISGDSTGVRDTFKPNFTYGSAKDQVSIKFSLNNSPFGVPCEFIHDGNIGAFDIRPSQKLENHDGSRIIVTNDFYGATRDGASPLVGPLQDIRSGTNQYVVYQGADFSGVVQEPYGGSAFGIPGTIQAEAYDKGGKGISYHDTTVGNQIRGPYRAFEDVDTDFSVVGWIDAGEWLEYTVDVAETGLYNVALQASSNAGGGSLHIEFDGVDKTGLMTIPNTSGWNNYTTVSLRGISLNAGQHIMRVYADSSGWNFDYVAFSKNDGINHYLPVADWQSVTTVENTAKVITLTGRDGDFDHLTYTIVNQPLYGTLSGAAPNAVYTPNPGFGGRDAFAFKVNDGTADSAIAVVSIMVDPEIGEDNFDAGGSNYATRTQTSTSHTATLLFNVVSRNTVKCPDMIDTSVAAGGVVGINPNDVLGFLETNKTDKFFGMYRVNGTLTYTFNIAGYTNLHLAFDMATSGANNAGKGFSISSSIDGGPNNIILNDGVDITSAWTEYMDNETAVTNAYKFTMFVNGTSSPHLTDQFQTYNPKISGTGSVLTLAIKMTSTVGGYGGYGLDNVRLYGTPVTHFGYYGWIDTYGLSVSNSLPTADPDGDGRNNFDEYAFGGNPGSPDSGHVPTAMRSIGQTNFLEYVYARRKTPHHGLVYTVESSSTLLSNDWSIAEIIGPPVVEPINDQLEAVTIRIPITEGAAFIRACAKSSP
jgi:hypothetical protein